MAYDDNTDEEQGSMSGFTTKYIQHNLVEQFQACTPICLYLATFDVLTTSIEEMQPVVCIFGFFCVVFGLLLFLEGLKLGVMPFCEVLGGQLPSKLSLPYLIGIFFIMGIGVTIAEPAIGALRTIGALVPPSASPYLFLLLNDQSTFLQVSCDI